MARRQASRCGEAQKDHRCTKSPAEGSTETDAFCEFADSQQGTGYRIFRRNRNARRTWRGFAEPECYSGCFAKSRGCRKEVRSTKPAWSQTFRDAWRFSDRAGRKTDDTGLTWTETIAKQKCSGRIAECAGCFAKSRGCRKEVRSTKPAWSETFRNAWCFANGETFRGAGRFSDRAKRKNDDARLT
jgi:hypothetical protein